MISKNKKGKMTMDKLAQMTAKGFSKVDEKFNDLREEFTGLRGEVNGLKDRVEKMEDKIDNGVNKMLVIADGMAKQFSDWKQENAFGTGIESRQNEQLKDHEVRIRKLETV